MGMLGVIVIGMDMVTGMVVGGGMGRVDTRARFCSSVFCIRVLVGCDHHIYASYAWGGIGHAC